MSYCQYIEQLKEINDTETELTKLPFSVVTLLTPKLFPRDNLNLCSIQEAPGTTLACCLFVKSVECGILLGVLNYSKVFVNYTVSWLRTTFKLKCIHSKQDKE